MQFITFPLTYGLLAVLGLAIALDFFWGHVPSHAPDRNLVLRSIVGVRQFILTHTKWLAFGGVVIFILPLIVYWVSGRTSYCAIGALLPWSDASGWFYSGAAFLHFGTIDSWAMRRPLNPASLAFWSWLMGENLRATLLFKAVLAGAAVTLAAREISRTWSLWGGFIVYSVLFVFAVEFYATTLSETLGLMLGACAFGIMWQSIGENGCGRFLLGLFLLTLALSARPGPILVLPVLALWSGSYFRDEEGLFSWAVALKACSVIAGGASVTMFWDYAFGAGRTMPGSNYAFVLYGLAYGGKSWHQFFVDYPTWSAVPEALQSAYAYRLAFDEILRNPLHLIAGLGSFLYRYFHDLFVYMPREVRGILIGLMAIGLIRAFKQRKQSQLGFLFAGTVGVFGSAPFIYWGWDAYRTFISTAFVDAGLAALGFDFIYREILSVRAKCLNRAKAGRVGTNI